MARIFFIFFLFVWGCKTSQEVADFHVPADAPLSGCVIKGEIVNILAADTDSGTCSEYPCRAQVRIMDIISCGSSVSLFFNSGDILEMQFAYTLGDTRKALPGMKEHYPGLKKGAVFTTVAHQRMRPGAGEYFVVYGYKRE